MKKQWIYAIIIGAVFVIGPTRQVHGQDASEESLIRAWAAQQESDPKNQVFEKIAPRRYRFQTSHFPFAGELRIINVIIQEYPGGNMEGWQTGTLEVELLDLPDDFEKKHSRSYSVWEGNNQLHYNPERKEWISSMEFMKELNKRMSGLPWPLTLLNNSSVITSIVILALLFVLSRKAQKRIDKSIERADKRIDKSMAAQETINERSKRSLQLSENALKLQAECNRLLAEILQVLKNGNKR